jgi:trehalose 6-phosphate phosphatase
MSAVWLGEVEGALLQRIAAADRLFCFLDYDGTLAPLAPTPDKAYPLPGTTALLNDLVADPGTQVAVVTGRTVHAIRRILDVRGLYYIGIHGLEIRLPSGAIEMSEGVAIVRSILPALKQQLQHALGGRPGILIEDKGPALACHYRLASREDAGAARQRVTAVAQTYQRRGVKIVVRQGHEVVEVRPAYVNKGKTACMLLAANGPAALAVYIGDDQTDEDAFTLLPSDSITIRVGPPTVPTVARYRVDEPEDVHRFLRAVIEHRRGQRSAVV